MVESDAWREVIAGVRGVLVRLGEMIDRNRGALDNFSDGIATFVERAIPAMIGGIFTMIRALVRLEDLLGSELIKALGFMLERTVTTFNNIARVLNALITIAGNLKKVFTGELIPTRFTDIFRDASKAGGELGDTIARLDSLQGELTKELMRSSEEFRKQEAVKRIIESLGFSVKIVGGVIVGFTKDAASGFKRVREETEDFKNKLGELNERASTVAESFRKKLGVETEDWIGKLRELPGPLGKFFDELEKFLPASESVERAMARMGSAMQKIGEEIPVKIADSFNEFREIGLLTFEEIQLEFERNVVGGLQSGIASVGAHWLNLLLQLRSSAKATFGQILQSFIDMVRQILVEALALLAIRSIFTAIGLPFLGRGGIAGLLKSPSGGGSIEALPFSEAQRGIVTRGPMAAIIGEREPELVAPVRSLLVSMQRSAVETALRMVRPERQNPIQIEITARGIHADELLVAVTQDGARRFYRTRILPAEQEWSGL